MKSALFCHLAKRCYSRGQITLAVDGCPIDQSYVLRGGNWWARGVLKCLGETCRQLLISGLFDAEKAAFYARVNVRDIDDASRFSWSTFTQPIAVNLWDELDEGSTALRVHVDGMPLSERREVLRWVQQQLPADWLAARGIEVALQVSDGAVAYPGLLATEHKRTLHFCWELYFSGLQAQSFDALNDKLASLLHEATYQQCAVSYSCES